VYSSIKSVKALYKAFNRKLKVEVVVMKRFIVSKFLNLKMTSIIYGQICSCIQHYSRIYYCLHIQKVSVMNRYDLVSSV